MSIAGSQVLILCYHSVSEDWPEVGSVTPGELERQVRHLLHRGYTPRTLSAARAYDEERRTLVITFDDAFQSVLDRAFPVLHGLGVPATLFVPTHHVSIGAPLAWSSLGRWLDTQWEHELRCMTWDGVRELERAGWQVGSHTSTHPRLTDLDDNSLAEELDLSRRRCEEELQSSCRSLAYPFGVYDKRVVAAAAAAGYEQAVILGDRLLDPVRRSDPLRISREGIYRSTSWRNFLLATSPSLSRLRASPSYARLGGALDGGLQRR